MLLGPSGCGKTTTLRCVAGLEQPTAGEIAIGGEVVSAPERGVQVPPRLRNIGMVFQSYAVWPHMTVWQNVAYPLRHRRTPRAEMRPQGQARCSSSSGLSEYAGGPWSRSPAGRCSAWRLRAASSTSRGSCCSTSRCRNLDAKLRLRLRDDLRRIIKQTGVTALYVTHDQAEAVVLGDRIGVMRDGKLLQMALGGRALQSPGRPVRRELHRRVQSADRPRGGARRRVRHRRGVRRTGSRPGCRRACRRARRSRSRCGRRTCGWAPTARPSRTGSPRASPASATRARRPSTSSPCWAAGSKRSSSARA